jgi:excisionase family DNA binding protein
MSVNVPPAYDIPSFCKSFGIGRSYTYEEIARGRLRATKVGRRTLIAGTDALTWLENYRAAVQSQPLKAA